MKIKGSQRRHLPYHFRQHSESYDHKKLSAEAAELLNECRVFETYGLKYGNTFLCGV